MRSSARVSSIAFVVSLGVLSGALHPNAVVQGSPEVDEAQVTTLKVGYQALTEQAAVIIQDVTAFAASPGAEHVQGLALDFVRHLSVAVGGSGLTQITNVIAAIDDAKAIARSVDRVASTPEGAAFRGRILTFSHELRAFLGNLLDSTSEIAAAEARDLLMRHAGLTPDQVANLQDTALASARSVIGRVQKFLNNL